MTPPSLADNDPPRRSRARRREAMINAVATILGCMALVVMIATVVRVVMVKLWESARVNPEYVQSVYDEDIGRRWSGKAVEQPSLLSDTTDTEPEVSVVPPPGPSAAAVPPPSLSTHSRSLPLGDPLAFASKPPPQAVPPPPTAIQNIEVKRPSIESSIRGFFAATGVEEKLHFSRDPQRVRPLMENYYQNHAPAHLEWKDLGWILPVEEPGFRLGYAQAIFANAEPVSVIIEEMADGSFRVDWESSVRYGEIGWAEFLQTQPTVPKLFRVIASKPRHMPPGETPQDSEVLEIKHPDDDDVIFAYFDRKDPKFQPLIQQLQTGNWKNVPLTLRLCYPGPAGSGKNARIADVEGKGWLILQGTRS